MADEDLFDQEDLKSYEKCFNLKKRFEPLTSGELEQLKFLLSDQYLPRQRIWDCGSLSEIVFRLVRHSKLTIPTVLKLLRECLYHMECFDVLNELGTNRQKMEKDPQLKEGSGVLISDSKVFLYQLHMSMYVEQVEKAKSWFREKLKDIYGKFPPESKLSDYWKNILQLNFNRMSLFRLFLEFYDVDDSRNTVQMLEIINTVCGQCHQHSSPSGVTTLLFLRHGEKKLLLEMDAKEEENDEDAVLVLPGIQGVVESQIITKRNGKINNESPNSSDVYERLDPNSKRKKLCLIININKFSVKWLKERRGSLKDVETLKSHFEKRRYETVEVPIQEKTTVKALKQVISCYIQEAPKLLVLFLMSHGCSRGIYLANGDILTLPDLVDCLGVVCGKQLTNVPKIIFAQACLGDKNMIVGENNVGDGGFFQRFPSNMLDIFLATATIPGFTSFRHPHEGSVFIKALVQILERHIDERINVCDLMQMVVKELSQQTFRVGSGVNNCNIDECVQIPPALLTLRGKVIL